jgi:hypothetical protein
MYRVLYAAFRPLWRLLKALRPRYFTTTEQVGCAMLKVAKQGAPKPVLESEGIRALGARSRRSVGTRRSLDQRGQMAHRATSR